MRRFIAEGELACLMDIGDTGSCVERLKVRSATIQAVIQRIVIVMTAKTAGCMIIGKLRAWYRPFSALHHVQLL
jgi:hypothetical protein